jgi:hypothetical protein
VTVLLAAGPAIEGALPARDEHLVFRNLVETVGTDPAAIVAYIKDMTATAADEGEDQWQRR